MTISLDEDPTVQLSEHFTLQEMVFSDYAMRNGVDNTPPDAVVVQLTLLCKLVLEPVRLFFNRPIIITSGYRSPEVNFGIGGSPTSQHPLGQAADLHILDLPNLSAIKAINNLQGVHFDQLIYEFGPDGWVHISRSQTPRRQLLRAYRLGGKTVYEPMDIKDLIV